MRFLNSIIKDLGEKALCRNGITVLIMAVAGLAGIIESRACTSAIIGAEMNPSGRPILWKHRDTSAIDNKVEFIPANGDEYGFVALYNASDKNLKEAWMGMNDHGFAIMNTASYNIKDDKVSAKKMDKEGIVMSKALRTCRTVEDFARLLEEWPRPMGVEANFGVIDATGNGAYFETNNHSYRRYDLKDAPDHVLVRTNYSHSGRPGEGYGHVREANANCELAPHIAVGCITPEVLTEELSRHFYHDGRKEDLTMSGRKDVLDEDYIPRYKSTATIAIEGCRPVETPDSVTPGFVENEYIMWTGIGYPPVSEIRAVRCAEDGVDPDLQGLQRDGHSKLSDQARRDRDAVFTLKGKNKYVDISRLFNAEGTGIAQLKIQKNAETYRREKEKRDKKIDQ